MPQKLVGMTFKFVVTSETFEDKIWITGVFSLL